MFASAIARSPQLDRVNLVNQFCDEGHSSHIFGGRQPYIKPSTASAKFVAAQCLGVARFVYG
jgi:hypothetical protein